RCRGTSHIRLDSTDHAAHDKLRQRAAPKCSPVLLTHALSVAWFHHPRLHNPALSVARFCGGTTLPHAASCSADSRPSRWITSPESLWVTTDRRAGNVVRYRSRWSQQ